MKEDVISIRHRDEKLESAVKIVATTLADSAVQVGVVTADKIV